MNAYKKLGRNTLIFTIGNIGSSLITFIMLPIYTNFLSTNEYGIIDFITVTLNFLLPILTLNIAEAILRFGIDKNYNNKKVFTTAIYIFIGIAIIIYPIFFILFKNSNLSINSELAIFIIINVCLYPIFQQFTRAIGKVKIYAISDILYTLIFAIFNIIFIVNYKMGIKGYFVAFLLAKLIVNIFLIIFSKLYKFFSFNSYDKIYAKSFIKYSIPLIPNSLSWWIVNLSDRYALLYFCGGSILGVYSVANKIPTILSTLYGIFSKAWQVSSFEEYDNDKKEVFYSSVMKYLFIFMTLIAMIMIIFIDFIADIFIGDSFYEAIVYIPILIIAFVFSAYSSFLGTIYTASKNTNEILKTTIFSAIINIIINIIFIPLFGPMIAAWSTLISYLSLFIYRLLDVRKYVKIKFSKLNLIICSGLLLSQAIVVIEINNIYLRFIINLIIMIIYFFMQISSIIKIYKEAILRRIKTK